MIYRDRITGKFAAKSTWTRSKAQGGKRYVRQSTGVPKIYRDRITGKFAAKSTWTRSKAQGGKRYVRQSTGVPKREPVKGDAIKRSSAFGKKRGTPPASLSKIKTARDYEMYYDDFPDYEDQGEVETGVDY